MSYSDYRQSSGSDPVSRPEWWRRYLAQKSRRVAEHRMRWFYLFGFLMILVAAVFLVPMFFVT